MQAVTLLQDSTRLVLESNGISHLDENLGAYPSIASLLKMDKNDLGNPFAGGISNVPAGDLPGIKIKKPKKPRKPKDPDAPQRPQTAFFLFQMAKRDEYKARMKQANPDVKPGEVQKQLTEDWNKMSTEQQKVNSTVIQATHSPTISHIVTAIQRPVPVRE